MTIDAPLHDAPGLDLVRTGLTDLGADRLTAAAALVLMGQDRLRSVGIDVPARELDEPAGHLLYDLLSDDDPRTAHANYNALVGRLLSFLGAAEHATAGRR